MSGETERYDKDPLLAIIESYALDVIGELSPEEVDEAACAVEELLGDGGGWRAAVRRCCGWSAALVDAQIADAWRHFRAGSCDEEGPDAAEFARRFADDVVRLSRS